MEEKLLTLINRDWTSPALDGLMGAMSSEKFWIGPLLAVAAFIIVYGRFHARAMLAVLTLAILVSNNLVGDGLKYLIRRPRPNEVVAGVRIVALNLHQPMPRLMPFFFHLHRAAKPRDSSWILISWSRPDPANALGRSFPSDHTLNNFCAAMILTFFYRRFGWLYFLPASLVAYSRIYVGSHWPSDVAISIVMAVGISLLLLALCEWLWRKFGPRMLPQVYESNPNLWQSP